LLLALAAEGLVMRRAPSGRYRLGALLVGLGHAARAAVSLTELVESALEDLADALGATAFAGVVAGTSVQVLASWSVPHPYGQTVTTGARLPLRAPVGLIYVAWSEDAAFDAWLNVAEPALDDAQRRALHHDRDTVRSRGWSATVARADGAEAAGVREVGQAYLTAERITLLGMSAPVWEPNGDFACSLALTGFRSSFDGPELLAAASVLTTSASAVTAVLRGEQVRTGLVDP
jgi:DNA-binding IclR family transcriptional regulator